MVSAASLQQFWLFIPSVFGCSLLTPCVAQNSRASESLRSEEALIIGAERAQPDCFYKSPLKV